MTLTNHIQRIETLASECLHHVDRKEYHQAHSVLDGLEMNVLEVRRHIDHLQNVTDFAARPAGGD